MKMSERDERLIEIHSEMYPFVDYSSAGDLWFIESPDYDETFDTYEEFLEFIETEVKEALLTYALNGELMELAEALGEEA
jgi:hypothetical protein